MIKAILFVLALSIAPLRFALALDCGSPPPAENEELEGDVRGEAQLLSRFIGNALLSGKIRTAKEDFFAKYPDADRSRTNAFFLYAMCESIFNDESLTEPEKRTEFSLVRREILGIKASTLPKRVVAQWQSAYPLPRSFDPKDPNIQSACKRYASCLVVKEKPTVFPAPVGARFVLENRCDVQLTVYASKDSRIIYPERGNDDWMLEEFDGRVFSYSVIQPKDTLELDVGESYGGGLQVIDCEQ